MDGIAHCPHCSSFERALKLFQRLTIQNGRLCQAGTSCLVETASNQVQLAHAVGIGIDRDFDAAPGSFAGIFRTDVEAVWAGVYLDEAAALTGVFDNTSISIS